MDARARWLTAGLVIAGCGPEASSAWSSCEEARRSAVFSTFPSSLGLSEPILPGDALPVISRRPESGDAEILATRALALACLLGDDEVEARGAILEWAENAVKHVELEHTTVDAFNPEFEVTVQPTNPPSLVVRREALDLPRLDNAAREAIVTAVADRIFEDGAIEGATRGEIGRHRVILNGTETVVGGSFPVMLGRARLGHLAVGFGLDRSGRIDLLSVPLVSFADTTERRTARVAESDANERLLEKVLSDTPEEVEVELDSGSLRFPFPDVEQSVEPRWYGVWLETVPNESVGVGTAYMSLLDPDAPLIGR